MKKINFKNLFPYFLFLLLFGCNSSKPLIDKKLSDLSVSDLIFIVIFIILLAGTFFVRDPKYRQFFESWLIITIIMVVTAYCSYHLFN